MAKAMRASGDLNPKATRVISRILVLTDSMRPLDRPCSIAARIEAWVFDDATLQLHEGGNPAAPRPPDPDLERLRGLGVGQLEDQSQAFFEQVGTVQPRVGLGDPGQLGLLPDREVLGVLPQRVAGMLQRLRVSRCAAGTALGGRSAGLVPGSSADLVEGVGGPPDDVEGVGAADRVGAVVGDHSADPVRTVGGDVGDLAAPLLTEGVEEALEGGLVPAGGGPDQPTGVVVDDHGQVAVAALVGDLIDPDPA